VWGLIEKLEGEVTPLPCVLPGTEDSSVQHSTVSPIPEPEPLPKFLETALKPISPIPETKPGLPVIGGDYDKNPLATSQEPTNIPIKGDPTVSVYPPMDLAQEQENGQVNLKKEPEFEIEPIQLQTHNMTQTYITFRNTPFDVHAIKTDKTPINNLRNAGQRLAAIKAVQTDAKWATIPPARHGYDAPDTHLVITVITDAGDSEIIGDTDWILVSSSQYDNRPTSYHIDWNVLLVNNSTSDCYVTIHSETTSTTLIPQGRASGFKVRDLTLSIPG